MNASYVIYANYINLCCGVQMEPTLNIKIGNFYVYDYKIKNVLTTGNLELDLTPMIDLTLESFADELSRIGLNDKVNIKQFWNKLDEDVKSILIENYSSSYLKDITYENITDNLDKILYYIRKEIINKREMHLIIQMFEESEVNDPNIGKYRMLVIDAYNAKIKIENSGKEPREISFDCYNQFSTEVIKYIDEFKTIHSLLIDYIDKNEETEEPVQKLIQKSDDFAIKKDKNKLLELLLIVNNIALYHFRNVNFFKKIERIIDYFKPNICDMLNKFEIINIFEDNPRIFLYLINKKIIPFDIDVYNSCRFSKYKDYFIKQRLDFKEKNSGLSALDEQEKNKIAYYNKINERGNSGLSALDDNEEVREKAMDSKFVENQKIGENENAICQLIRNDQLEGFIEYIAKNNIQPTSHIEKSRFETNPMLKNNDVSLIEYAAFFGSSEIFKYINIERNVELNPSIWKFAIHGGNLEIIRYIGEKKVYFNTSNIKLFETLVQCHDSDIYNYFISNYYTNENQTDENQTDENQIYKKQIIEQYEYEFPLKYRNYTLISNKMPDNKFLLRCIYEYNLFKVFDDLLRKTDVKLNKGIWNKYAVKYSNLDIIKLALGTDRHHYNTKLSINIPPELIKISKTPKPVLCIELVSNPPTYLRNFKNPDHKYMYKSKDDNEYYRYDILLKIWFHIIFDEEEQGQEQEEEKEEEVEQGQEQEQERKIDWSLCDIA